MEDAKIQSSALGLPAHVRAVPLRLSHRALVSEGLPAQQTSAPDSVALNGTAGRWAPWRFVNGPEATGRPPGHRVSYNETLCIWEKRRRARASLCVLRKSIFPPQPGCVILLVHILSRQTYELVRGLSARSTTETLGGFVGDEATGNSLRRPAASRSGSMCTGRQTNGAPLV